MQLAFSSSLSLSLSLSQSVRKLFTICVSFYAMEQSMVKNFSIAQSYKGRIIV